MYSLYCLGGLLVIILIVVVVTIYYIFIIQNRRMYPPPPILPLAPPSINLNQTPQISQERAEESQFDSCVNCGKSIPIEFDICPYCETTDPFKPQTT